jgi:hypothetical protein
MAFISLYFIGGKIGFVVVSPNSKGSFITKEKLMKSSGKMSEGKEMT